MSETWHPSRCGRVALVAIVFTVSLAGCTVHLPGERVERDAADRAGAVFLRSPATTQPLPDDATPQQLVDHALRTNGEVEQKYWEWRAAIEQVPQDGTQAGNFALFGSIDLARGATGLESTMLSAGNDPMADIVLPAKLSTAARRALENARAAGRRFRKAQLELRDKVLAAWYDYALTAELIRLEQTNEQLLKTTAMVVEARNRAGAAGQQDLLKARNEADLSANDVANLQAQLPAQRAALNALLSRPTGAAIRVPQTLPTPASPGLTDEALLTLAATQNPELNALASEMRAKHEGITLARLQYLPDFSISAGTDLAGIGQSVMGMVTVPLFRHEAIDAAVAQAQANLRAIEAMRRQAGRDLGAQLIMELATVRDADRQLALFDQTILPRAKQIVTVARSAYETGQATLLDLLDAQRSLITLERLVANLRAVRAKRVADLETLAGEALRGQAK